MPKNISVDGISTDDIAKITEKDATRLSRYRVQTGDIIYSRRGDVEKCTLVKKAEDGWLCGTGCLRIRLGKEAKISPVFLHAYLSHPAIRRWIVRHAVGATMPNLNTSILNAVPVLIPSAGEMRVIVDIWTGTIDKVVLNRRINQTLEQIAQAIFKSWFVDFEPVKAKQHIRTLGGNDEQTERAAQAVIASAANLDVITTATDLSALDQQLIQALGKKLSHQTDAQREQLATTASHFPDQFVKSELGLIPEGWEATILAKVIRIIGGGTPKKSEPRYWDGTIPWFSVKDAPGDGQVYVLDTDLKITIAGLKESSTKLLDEGTTIISARGTVGRLALVGVPMAMNQSCYGVVGADGAPPVFNYFNLRRAVDVLKQNTHGAVFDTITRATFDTVEQLLPTIELINCFEHLVSPLLKTVKVNALQAANLVEFRDALLPKLLSGELDLSGVGRNTAEVA